MTVVEPAIGDAEDGQASPNVGRCGRWDVHQKVLSIEEGLALHGAADVQP
jgi:hypothetical protein